VIRSIQSLLVLSFSLWLCMPVYGAAAALSALCLLLGATVFKIRRARNDISPHVPNLTLSDRAKRWTVRFAVYFLDPAESHQWANTYKLSGLLCLLAAIGFVVRALITWQWSLFGFVAALLVLMPIIAHGGIFFDPLERLNASNGKSDRPSHDEAQSLLSLKRVTGAWPPSL
jgi:hypothetical protein